MFNGFANVWTPVEPSENVTTKPLKVRLAGEDLVLFRNKAGQAGALIDRCPHRSVALSIGKTCDDGTIECPFHGWRFDTEGACTFIPFNPMAEEKRRNYKALSLPTVEAGGLLWVYTGFEPQYELEVPSLMTDPNRPFIASIFQWKTHWTRGLENMLDYPHLPFAHRKTIGRAMAKKLTPEMRMNLTLQETSVGFTVESDSGDENGSALIEFRKPNCSVLSLMLPRRTMVIHIFAVPVDGEHTRMFLVQETPYRYGRWLWNLLARVNQKVIFEDQLVVESTLVPEIPEPGIEKSVATDGPTLAFRKYYHQQLRKSRIPHPWDERMNARSEQAEPMAV